MPKTNDLVSIRLEQARIRVHAAYTQAVQSIGGEAAWDTEDDQSILEIIDDRLRNVANASVDRIEQQWQHRVTNRA
jgi:hypothetical protein